MMEPLARLASLVFGVMMLLLSAAITLETVLRKAFSVSLGGVDELYGYAIAVGAPVAFAVAVVERSHIRINLLYGRMGLRLRALADAAAVLALAAISGFLFVFALRTLDETRTYQSLAQTPWATPLVIPQALWLAALGVFLVAAVGAAVAVVRRMARRDWSGLTSLAAPDSVEEALRAEVRDLGRR